MSVRKRNEFLEIDYSDHEDQGYNSEEEEGRAEAFQSRSSKRIKLDYTSDSEDQDDFLPKDQQQSGQDDSSSKATSKTSKPPSKGSPSSRSLSPRRKSSTKALDQQKHKPKSGVIYISRVPPFMKPQVVRNLLSPYGEVNRIFLTPEDPTNRTSRLKAGGNRRRLFTDGWVEFVHKKDAKLVAETLNAKIIGGRKRGRFHDEVWNIKYLKGLKWHHLVEQISNENAERAARMRAEIAQTTRENKTFLENVERAKMLEGMEEKRLRKDERRDVAGETAEAVGEVAQPGHERRRQFKQNEVKSKKMVAGVEKSEEVQRVLSKIF